jgi:hypothetical protein
MFVLIEISKMVFEALCLNFIMSFWAFIVCGISFADCDERDS